MEPREDHVLADEFRAGSEAAFVELMVRYQRLVFQIAFSYASDREEAMDMVQEVFLRVFEKRQSYSGSGSLRGWLLRVAHRLSLNWVRDHRSWNRRVEFTTANEPSVPASQECEYAEWQRNARLREELSGLSARQRHAVTLRYFDGLPVREVAAILECSEGVAKSILFRSLARLRKRAVGRAMEDW